MPVCGTVENWAARTSDESNSAILLVGLFAERSVSIFAGIGSVPKASSGPKYPLEIGVLDFCDAAAKSLEFESRSG